MMTVPVSLASLRMGFTCTVCRDAVVPPTLATASTCPNCRQTFNAAPNVTPTPVNPRGIA